MFTWHVLIFLWILLAFFCAGFAWTIGTQLATWLIGKIFK